jgi:hypothetical protein
VISTTKRRSIRPLIENRCTIALVMRMFQKSALLGVVAWISLFVVAGISVAYLQKGKSPRLGEGPRIEYPSGEMSQSAKEQFLQGNFLIIKDVRALPAPVLRAFTEQGGSRLTMANPGKDFQATDFILDDTLPSKRLIFAGVSGDRCFVHFEQGGRGHSYVLALFNVTSKDEMKPIWRGYCRAPAAITEDLRSWFIKGGCSQP